MSIIHNLSCFITFLKICAMTNKSAHTTIKKDGTTRHAIKLILHLNVHLNNNMSASHYASFSAMLHSVKMEIST